MCSADVFSLFHILVVNFSPRNLRINRTYFHQISPNVPNVFGRRLLIRSYFSDCSRETAMATNFTNKIGDISLFAFIRRLGTPKQSGISQFRKCDDLATSCKHLVNFGQVTPEFRRLRGVQPLVDQQFSFVRLAAPLLDAATISTEFGQAIRTQLFHLFTSGRHCYAAWATR